MKRLISAALVAGLPHLAVKAFAAPVVVGGWGYGIHSVNYSPRGTPVLSSFHFKWGGDHHIDEMGVILQNGKATGAFNDKNNDDYFGWQAGYEEISDINLIRASTTGHCTRGTCNHLVNRPDEDSVFALSGFRFKFGNNDHHIDQIQVYERKGVINVTYRDKNGDDPFLFDFQYVWVPRSAISTVVAPYGKTTRERNVPIPRGRALIAGFSFDFTKDDHQIGTVWLELLNGNALFKYFDKNADDEFVFSANAIILR